MWRCAGYWIYVHYFVSEVLILLNTLRPRQDGRYFADDVLKCIFLNENVWISLKIPLKFVSRGPNNNIPALVQIMAWRRPGDKPLSEPMLVFVPTHICITWPQWVNKIDNLNHIHMWQMSLQLSLFNSLFCGWNISDIPGSVHRKQYLYIHTLDIEHRVIYLWYPLVNINVAAIVGCRNS